MPFTIVYRHLPLAIHPFAGAAALASECAGAQGRFQDMHHLLYKNQKTLGGARWDSLAVEAQVSDVKSFARCMKDTTVLARIREDSAAATKLDANATPTLLIAGVRIQGVPPQAMLDSLIKESLRQQR